jgi:hypothetical protein
MYNGQREVLKLNLVLQKLNRLDAEFHLMGWLERGIPPEDIDRALITLDVLEEEVNKTKYQCDDALELIINLKRQLA